MSLISKLTSLIKGVGRSRPTASPVIARPLVRAVPTVEFDDKRVTATVKVDLMNNIREIREFDPSHLDEVYAAALRSISQGRDLGSLRSAIIDRKLPGMTKARAGAIAISLNNKATALIERDQQVSLGIKYATWAYSGAPCYGRKPSAEDIRRDAAHKTADGKRYDVSKGLRVGGRLTWPGRDDGCKCMSRSNIPGFR